MVLGFKRCCVLCGACACVRGWVGGGVERYATADGHLFRERSQNRLTYVPSRNLSFNWDFILQAPQWSIRPASHQHRVPDTANSTTATPGVRSRLQAREHTLHTNPPLARVAGTMAAPVLFVEAEYAAPPCTGLETREADGAWLGCTAYTHASRGDVVLWYGGETYEGLGGGYRWAGGSAPPGGPGPRSSGDAPELLDGDGDVVPTRWAEVGGRRAPASAGAATEAAAKQPRFLPFDEALAVARSLGLANRFEWQVWCKEGMRPSSVPAAPPKVYEDGGWQGWVHWLGSSGMKKPSKFGPFGQALAFAQSLGLANQKEWKVWCKEGRRPPNVPSHPNATYKVGVVVFFGCAGEAL